jgi:RHS repeat-associated protein
MTRSSVFLFRERNSGLDRLAYALGWVLPVGQTIEDRLIRFSHLDHLGTPLALTNEIRNICWSADYLPFGEIYSELIAPVSNEIRFPGQYHDRETGLYYNWHRYYKPTLGRYYQADPIEVGGSNRYQYASNSPLKNVDPYGKQCFIFNMQEEMFIVVSAHIKSEASRIGPESYTNEMTGKLICDVFYKYTKKEQGYITRSVSSYMLCIGFTGACPAVTFEKIGEKQILGPNPLEERIVEWEIRILQPTPYPGFHPAYPVGALILCERLFLKNR